MALCTGGKKGEDLEHTTVPETRLWGSISIHIREDLSPWNWVMDNREGFGGLQECQGH